MKFIPIILALTGAVLLADVLQSCTPQQPTEVIQPIPQDSLYRFWYHNYA